MHDDLPPQKLSKKDIHNLRQKHIASNVTLSYKNPLQIVRGRAQYLYDETGREYLDCINNVCHVGHCHPRVVAAGQTQMAKLATNTRYLHEYLPQYAEQLAAKMPAPLEVCFLVCSGSEANELALRIAYAHTGRRELLVLDHGYHGNTQTLVEISPYKFNGASGKPEHVHVVPLPDTEHDWEIKVPDNIAAFIAESLPSCGGQVVLPQGFLQAVYQQVRKAGGVCIADEVQVGFGRVGSHFSGFETQNVVPDIVTLGKPIGNGYPIGAVITTRAIAESFMNGMEYFNSFGGNPVACAVGLSVLQVMAEENLQQHALVTGQYLKQQLQSLKHKYAVINDVRGLGLFIGIELSAPGLSGDEFASLVVNRMKERGVLLSADGPRRNVIKIKPPLVFNRENCDFLCANLDVVLSQYFPA
jgi:4-aminobutyrate aminotransferase-like enzyme